MLSEQIFSQVMQTFNFGLKTNVLRNANTIFLDLMVIIRRKQIEKKNVPLLRGNLKQFGKILTLYGASAQGTIISMEISCLI